MVSERSSGKWLVVSGKWEKLFLTTKHLSLTTAFLITYHLSLTTALFAVKAFPSAEGFGAVSLGGRGGTVYEVTNLNDSGAGSLRVCIEASGARTCVFRTGGTITVSSELFITNPFITIAGQTAPGGGICVRSAGTFGKSPIIVRTHDVIIRHLRVRPGKCNVGVTVSSQACIQVGQDGFVTYNVIIDHCSLTWAIDTNTQTGSQAHDLTWQWNIISEGLNNAGHSAGNHSRALNFYVGSSGTDQDMNGKISVHHNLMSHVEYRVPQVSTKHGLVETVNNVVYHTTQIAMNINATAHCSDQACIDAADGKTRFVKNYLLRTNNSRNDIAIANDAPAAVKVYANGNIGPSRANDTLANNLSIETIMQSRWSNDPLMTDGLGSFNYPANSITEDASAQITFEKVSETGSSLGIKSVGAYLPTRDAVDTRILQQLQTYVANPGASNTVPVPGGPNQGLLDDPAQVGGYPVLSAGGALTDTDHDGIPDSWENSHSLNPNVASDGAVIASNGYTNLENYLNELAGDPVSLDTPLGAFAKSMTPGQWSVFSTVNLNQTFANSGGPSGSINGYADSMVWDPISKQAFFIGSDHYSAPTTFNGNRASFVSYSDSSNTWNNLSVPSFFPPLTGTGGTIQHGYDGRAIDPATGNLYYRRFHENAIHKYNVASQTWSDLPNPPSNGVPDVAALAWFPEVNGLIWVEGTGYNGIQLFRESSQTWTKLTGGANPGGTPQIWAEYDPIHHLVLVGESDTTVYLFKITTSDGVTAQVTPLNTPPLQIKWTLDGSSQFLNVSVDPISGTFLFITPGDGTQTTTREFWVYNVVNDTWSKPTNQPSGAASDWMLSVGSGTSGRQIVNTPISTYNVNMFVSCKYNQNSCAVILYKHASSPGADTTPPSAPTGLTPNVVSASQINLSWTASTDNVGVTGYRIYRCQGTGCSGFTQISTSTSVSYSDTGLTAATTYLYKVAATDAAGNVSSLSASSSATTLPGSIPSGGYPIPNIQDEKNTYSSWGWTLSSYASTHDPVTLADPKAPPYTITNPNVHYNTEMDDLWMYTKMSERGAGSWTVTRANGWVDYYENKYYQCLDSGPDQSHNYCEDRGFGLDHAQAVGLINRYQQTGDAAALATAKNIAGDIESSWTTDSGGVTGYTCYKPEGCTRYGLRAPGRHLLIITRLAEVTNDPRWISLRDTMLNILLVNNVNWDSARGMYFLSAGQTDGYCGVGCYAAGGRLVSAFHIGIFMEALFNVYRVTGRGDVLTRMLAMAAFVKQNGIDPTIQYTGEVFGFVGGLLRHMNGTSTTNLTNVLPPYTTDLVNTLVMGYKYTGDSTYLTTAKTYFNRGTKGFYHSETPRTADNLVDHYVDTRFETAGGQPTEFMDNNKGELFYTYLIFENGGNPTVVVGNPIPPSAPTNFKIDVP